LLLDAITDNTGSFLNLFDVIKRIKDDYYSMQHEISGTVPKKMIDGRKSKPKPQNPLHVFAKNNVAPVLSEQQWRFPQYVEILVTTPTLPKEVKYCLMTDIHPVVEESLRQHFDAILVR
jgi:hypothetical protein